MENATKALLIAAAVLVAIIIISLTLSIVRQGQEAVAGADMSEAEIEAFNSKFKTFEGNSVTTAQVNSLLSAVLSNNLNETQVGTNRYVVVKGVTATAGATYQGSSATSITKVNGNDYYKVKCVYNTNGLISSIEVTK